MLGTEGEPARLSQYSMQIECPQCGKKMILQIGLTGAPKDAALDCIGCHNQILPLVPGPILGGPFPATD
jgi:transcription elongation factor Elf1